MAISEKTGKNPSSKPVRILRILLIVILILVLLFALLVAVLSITEFKPADEESVAIDYEDPGRSAVTGMDLSITTWNIGYGALGDNADFFMDGGTGVKTADKTRVYENLTGIVSKLSDMDTDFIFLQETDRNSGRSYHVDEYQEIANALGQEGRSFNGTFAYNFKVLFIPYPIPPIGQVNSGIVTFSDCTVTDSVRKQLPCPFQWPVRLGNLKRCLMIDRIPVTDAEGNDTGKELVLINLHLEAYDSGEGKAAQTAMLKEVLEEEENKGNYVIAGGDFNQTFSNCDSSAYPELEGKWHSGEIDTAEFEDTWQFEMDPSVPTCRSLDQPLDTAESRDPDDFQYYVIDGFICSSNVQVNSVKTQDCGFVNSDHNPVVMNFTLKPEN